MNRAGMYPKMLMSVSVRWPRNSCAMKITTLAMTSARLTTGVDSRITVCRSGIMWERRLPAGRSSSRQSSRDLANHLGHLVLRQLGEDRDGQRRRGGLFRVDVPLVGAGISGKAFLLRQRQGVIDLA